MTESELDAGVNVQFAEFSLESPNKVRLSPRCFAAVGSCVIYGILNQGDEAAAPRVVVSPVVEEIVAPDYLAEGSLGSMEQSMAFSALESESKARLLVGCVCVYVPSLKSRFVLVSR